MCYEALHLVSFCGSEVTPERTSPDTQSCGHRSRTHLQPSPEGAVLKGLSCRFCFMSLSGDFCLLLSVSPSIWYSDGHRNTQTSTCLVYDGDSKFAGHMNVYTVHAKGEGGGEALGVNLNFIPP